MLPVQHAKDLQAARICQNSEIAVGEVGVADAESAEGVIAWHERRCETEIVTKGLDVV